MVITYPKLYELCPRYTTGSKNPLQESGTAVSTVNFYIRPLNLFLSWMFENDMTTEHLLVKRLKEPERVLKAFTDEPLRIDRVARAT